MVAVTVVAQWPWLNLHDDVRFTLGPLRAAWESAGPLDTFVHRPMANRLLMAGLDGLTGGPLPLREKLTVVWAVVAAAGASALLQTAVARRATARVAVSVALAVFASLAWASEAYVLQPEWTASVLSVAALGCALHWVPTPTGGRAAHGWAGRLWCGAAVLLLAVAVLQKYTTVTAALLALLVVVLVDRRRGLLLAVAGGATGLVLLGATFLAGSTEWQWFTETSRLNPSEGLRFDAFGEWAVNWAWNNPVLLAWPAAAALAARLSGRRSWVGGSVAASVIVLAVTVLQNQFFGYHGTPLLPAAAGVVAYAAVRWTEVAGTLLLGLVPLVAWVAISWAVYPAPVAWRFGYRYAMAGWLLLVVVVIALVVWGQARASDQPRAGAGAQAPAPPRSWLLPATVALLAVAVTFPGWPATPYGFFGQDRSRRSEVERQAELEADAAGVRAVVGDATVVYLADGETAYFVGNRTDCAYPGAVVLYRSLVPGVGALRSFADNLACLEDPAAAYLVLQTWRVPFDELDPRVEATVAREFDCARGVRVRELLVCPRR